MTDEEQIRELYRDYWDAMIARDADALRADYAIRIKGGDIGIYVSGNGSKALKSKCQTDATATVRDGGAITISGGRMRIEVLGDTYTSPTGDTSDCVAVAADKTLTQTDGAVDILAMGQEAIPVKVEGEQNLSGGEWHITRLPWKIRTRDYAYDMTVYGVVALNGRLLNDYSDKAVGAFIGDECVGYGIFEDTDYGTLRIRSNVSSSRQVTFKCYDYTTGKETVLYTDTQVVFADQSVVGTPGYPIVLYSGQFLRGDVNADGTVDISDVLCTVSHILGQPVPVFIRQAAVPTFGNLVKNSIHIALFFNALTVVFAIIARHFVLDFLITSIIHPTSVLHLLKPILKIEILSVHAMFSPIQNQQEAEQHTTEVCKMGDIAAGILFTFCSVPSHQVYEKDPY